MPTFRELARSIRLLFARRSVERELDEEIRFHVDMETRRHVDAGMLPADARALAERDFGGVIRVKDELRGVHGATVACSIDATWNDVRHALRSLAHTPGFTATAIVTLALGIGANVTMFTMLERLLLKPPAHVVAPDRLVVFGIQGHFKTQSFVQETVPYPGFVGIRRALEGKADVATVDYQPTAMPLGRGVDAQSVTGQLVSGNFFRVLGAQPALGRFFRDDEDVLPIGSPVVVISNGAWKRLYGAARNVVGRQIDIGPGRYTIIGVAPAGFTGMAFAPTDVWIPVSASEGLRFAGGDWATKRNTTWLRVIARLDSGMTPARAAQYAAAGYAGAGEPRWEKQRWSMIADPLPNYLHKDLGADAKITILLTGVSTLVLLIACANLANLLLARSLRRRRETAVRLALGASRGRLAAQIVIESMLIAGAGGITALGVARWSAGLAGRMLFSDMDWLESPVDAPVVLYAVLVAAAAGLLASIVPAIQTSRPDLTTALKTGIRDGGDRSRSRSALLVLQAALSVLLLVGTGLFVRSLRSVTTQDIGIEVDRVLLATMDLKKVAIKGPDSRALYERMIDRVRSVPGVERASLAVTVPSWSSYMTAIKVPGIDSLPAVESGEVVNAVDPEYFATMGMRILRGRGFTSGDGVGSARVAVINETLAQAAWPALDPIGRCVKLGADTAPCLTVVGVAANSHRQDLVESTNYHVHVPLAQAPAWLSGRVIAVRPVRGMMTATTLSVRMAMQTAASNLPYAEVRPLATRFDRELRPWRMGAMMFGAFGALALVLASVGLYGVVSFGVTQRTHELGVRMALGAQSRRIIGMVLRETVALVALGTLLGLVGALVGGRFVEPLLFRTSARDPAIYSAVIFTVLFVAVVAALLPAWRAARVDPLTALRAE